jgi:DNA mismatch repair ATPase MutS
MGSYFNIIEEDADYFHKEFKFDYNPSPASYNVTGFPTYAIDKWKKKLLEKGINFCIVDEVEPVNKTIVREVIFSSCSPESVGLTFTGGPSSK